MSASGAIAKTQVYGSWRGIQYARRYVTPANPQSTEQMLTRDTFSFLNNVWKLSPAGFTAPWTAAAQGRPYTNRNLFLSKNNGFLRTLAVLTGMTISPGAKGGISSPITITPGAGTLTAAGSDPDPLPSGWSVVGLGIAAILQQDPQTGTDYVIEYAEDAATPFSAQLAGLAAGTWVAGAFWKFQRSALATDIAYSPAVGAEYTVT